MVQWEIVGLDFPRRITPLVVERPTWVGYNPAANVGYSGHYDTRPPVVNVLRVGTGAGSISGWVGVSRIGGRGGRGPRCYRVATPTW
eukprot:754890-Hanusia_phi.AAC.8